MALTKEQIEKMDAALGKKASSPAQYAQRSNAAYTGGLSQDKFSQMDRLLTKRAVASRPSSKKEEEEKDALGLSTKWYKNPIGALSRTFVDTFVKTAAKPFGEVVASSYELAGKEAPQWTEANRLASPELRSLKYGLGTAEQRAEMERLRQSGAQGAGFTDVLNVVSLLPAGRLAKVAGGTGLLSKTARVLPKGIVGKGVETGAEILKGAAKSEGLLKNAWTATKAAAPAGAGWGAAYGLASGVDERKSAGETAMSTLGGAATGLALGTGFAVAGAGIGKAFQKVNEIVNADAKAAAIARKNTNHFAEIEGKYGAVQRSVEQAKKTGINPIEFSATYDLLPVVDREGNIRVDNTGGALERLDAMLSPHEETVRKNLVREGRNIKVTDLRPILEKSVNESGLEGAALDNAYAKIDAELRGLARRADKDGYIPMTKVHDAKVSKYKTVDYTNEGSKIADKAIARGLKQTIEQNTKSINVGNINNDLAQLYSVRDFLESLQNKKVKGGRLGKYFAQTVGSVIGSHFGPVGSIVGAEAGGTIRGQMLKSAFGKETGNVFKPSDELLRATKLGKEARPYNPLQLPSPEQVKASELQRKNSVIIAPYEPKYGEPGYSSLGSRNTTQSTTIAPTMKGISRTVAQNTDIVQPTQAEIRARLVSEGKQGVYGKPLLGLPSPDRTKSGVAIPMRQSTQFEKPASIIGGEGQTSGLPLKKAEQPKVTKRGLKKQAPTQAKSTPVEAQKSSKVKTGLLNSKSPDAALMEEAKKYRTAEEFVKAKFSERPDYAMSHRPTFEGMPPAFDLTEGDAVPKDVYQHPEYSIASGRNLHTDKSAKESWDVLKKIRNNPEADVTIYRAARANKLNIGDWITLSKNYAKDSIHDETSGLEKVYSFKVKAKDIIFAGDDINEFGYYPKSKLLDIYNKAHGK